MTLDWRQDPGRDRVRRGARRQTPREGTMYRVLALLLTLGLLAVPLATQAQPVGKVYRIGYLGNLPITAQTAHLWEAFLSVF